MHGSMLNVTSREASTSCIWALQDTLRRVSAEMAQSKAQRCAAQESRSAPRRPVKKRNWFMRLFKGDSKGSRDGK